MELSNLRNRFSEIFGVTPTIIRAPGRVNIIGEHTDYNEGFVLPFSISKAIYFACSLRDDNEFHIHADDLKKFTVITSNNADEQPGWVRFFVSAIKVLKQDKHDFKGLNIITQGDIPFGAGISSSSALTCGFLYSVVSLNQLDISRKEIVFLASRAENGTGVNGGKMDQFAICMGKANHALLIDCKDYKHTLIKNNIEDANWVLFNTNVEHNLADTEYNDRRGECESAINKIKKEHPQIKSPRDLNLDSLNEHILLISKKEFNRLTHVIEENDRVHQMIEALRDNDLDKIGQLLYESHESLSQIYEVSCEELDYIAANLLNEESCIGARMMGGGFGGCVIALIKDGHDKFHTLRKNYKKNFNLEMDIISVNSDDGINIVS